MWLGILYSSKKIRQKNENGRKMDKDSAYTCHRIGLILGYVVTLMV